MTLLYRALDYLRAQNIGVLIAYAISGLVFVIGTLMMLLVITGAIEMSFGP